MDEQPSLSSQPTPELVDPLLRGLDSADYRARAAAVAALGQWGDHFAEAIAGVLGDRSPQVRVAAIRTLERLQSEGAWRDRLVYERYVPAGPFLMGSDESVEAEERPAHRLYLEGFWIGRYPVTNADYARFIESTGCQPPVHWPGGHVPAGKEMHPVVEVSWFDARAYAEWAGMRLLTEAEWEKAASWETGGRKRKYPWGDHFDAGLCDVEESGIGDTVPVGTYSPGADCPCGCVDMAGNVWEWTSSLYLPYPYRADDGREDPMAPGNRVLRGGSWYPHPGCARCTARDNDATDYHNGDFGFRCGFSSGDSV